MTVNAESRFDKNEVWMEILEKYKSRTVQSLNRFEEACQYLPKGDTRPTLYWDPYPTFMAEGHGCKLIDVDGNEYFDFLNNYTSLIHGHNHPEINAAIQTQVNSGTILGSPMVCQVSLAKHMVERVSSIEQIRFTNSGTEAVNMALRGARAFTGREKIVKIEGGYHGNSVIGEASTFPPLDLAGPREQPNIVPWGEGIPKNEYENVIVIPFNDLQAANQIVESHKKEVAALLVEPHMGAAGQIPAEDGYLKGLRDVTKRHNVLLVFDEIQCFRLGYGGVEGVAGVIPDLSLQGKIIGGGFAFGAFGGRKDIMDVFSPDKGRVTHLGTFNGHCFTMAAGLAGMKAYDRLAVDRINGLGDQLRGDFQKAITAEGYKGVVSGAGSLLHVHYGAEKIREYRDNQAAAEVAKDFPLKVHLALMNEGIYCAKRNMFVLSTPMSKNEIDIASQAFRRVLKKLRPLAESEYEGLCS